MSTSPRLQLPQKENWGSKLGVVLAVAGSAVGLGNFLRFPGQAVNNGGGAFMIPYIVSFFLLGVPIAWCEWTMGRLGGRFGQNNGPGIMYALWRRAPAKAMGAMALLIPVVIYMYYVLLEAWCLDYFLQFASGGFAQSFADAKANAGPNLTEVQAVVGASIEHHAKTVGLHEHGALLGAGRMLWLVLICFIVNFVIIYQGVTRGIERFCKWAMPALILCALIILVRVLTLPNITSGLGFMWNPDWSSLADPQVWLAAAGQIFFSLSVGFGLILCYSSYLRSQEDVVLTSLSASSANEFCEVILGGMIVVPTAFLFLGAQNAKGGTFGLGFETIPAIMNFMPGGSIFGAMWFGLLFLAAVTSSLSMLQPAIAFLEDGFGLKRRASITILAIVTAAGTAPIMYYSRGYLALDHTDFWCNLMMIIAATCQVLLFGWIIGAERGVKEMNRGADLKVPAFMAFVIRYVTPTFLIAILALWSWNNLPQRLNGISPQRQGDIARADLCRTALDAGLTAGRHLTDTTLSDQAVAERLRELADSIGASIEADDLDSWIATIRLRAATSQEPAPTVPPEVVKAVTARFGWPPPLAEPQAVDALALRLADETLPAETMADELAAATAAGRKPLTQWVRAVRRRAQEAFDVAAYDANVGRFVLFGVIVFYLFLIVLADLACRNRIGRTIKQAEAAGGGWEASR